MAAYYNEIEPYAADWLENLIDEGLIAHGDVDRRSIREVQPEDLRGYTQCHFFAGIGGWSYAARIAGWADDRPLWTGSCPCQPFSVAGKGKGEADDRHLWPDFYRLIDAARPACVFGEQVASKDGLAWFDGVRVDLESSGYAARGFVIPACAVDAPHRRERLWFVGHSDDAKRRAIVPGRDFDDRQNPKREKGSSHLENAGLVDCELANAAREQEREPNNTNGAFARARARDSFSRVGVRHGETNRTLGNVFGAGLEGPPKHELDASERAPAPRHGKPPSHWGGADWIECADGKRRRLEPGIALLADGLPREVAGMLAGFGNAIVPQVAAEILAAYLETY